MPMTPEQLIERASELVHKAYCNWYLSKHKKSYWTHGDYNLLDEETKNADRETTKAVLKVVLRAVKAGEVVESAGIISVWDDEHGGWNRKYKIILTPSFERLAEEK